jgi:hypothetical protein
MHRVAPAATPIRLNSPEFDAEGIFHLANVAPDDGQYFVSRFSRDFTLVQIHYRTAPGGYGFSQAYGAGGQDELRQFLANMEAGEPARQESGSVVTRVADFRYHMLLASTSGKPRFWCSSFDGLVGSAVSDRPLAAGRLWGFYCRGGYELTDEDVEELLQSLTLRA